MEHLILGRVGIAIQNKAERNEDIYQIGGGWQGVQATRELLDSNIEDPERFVVNTEGGQVNVYTKQPDAAVQLALFLNRRQGFAISDTESAQARKQLIRKQQ